MIIDQKHIPSDFICNDEIVELQNTITIGDNFLQGCLNVKRVILPDTLVKIRDNFLYGTNITEIIIPNSVRKIGDNFMFCSKIEDIKLSVDEIGKYCLCHTKCLKTAKIKANKIGFYCLNYSCVEQCELNIYETPWNSLQNCKQLKYFKSEAEIIGANFMKDSTIETLDIDPDKIWHGFLNGSNIEHISLNATVIFVDFLINTKNLKTVKLPNVKIIPEGFLNNSSVCEVEINPEEIHSKFMNQCPNIKSIHLPECVKIGRKFMNECDGIESVNIPKCIEADDYFMYKCESLSDVICDPDIKAGERFLNECPKITEVKINTLSEYCYCDSGITELNFEGTIPDNSFNCCNDLISVRVNGNIGYECFRFCKSLLSAELSSEKIDSYCFYQCESLKNIKIFGAKIIEGWFADGPRLDEIIIDSDLEEFHACWPCSDIFIINHRGKFTTDVKGATITKRVQLKAALVN